GRHARPWRLHGSAARRDRPRRLYGQVGRSELFGSRPVAGPGPGADSTQGAGVSQVRRTVGRAGSGRLARANRRRRRLRGGPTCRRRDGRQIGRIAARSTNDPIRCRVRRALALAALICLFAPANVLGADGRAEGQLVHLQHPDWPLPAWTANGPAVWTTVGAPYASSIA